MSGECNICGVMGCVESNHKETNVSEQTPAQIAAAIVRRELDAYYVSPRPMSQQAERFDLREAIADAIREAQTSSAAARDGEVGVTFDGATWFVPKELANECKHMQRQNAVMTAALVSIATTYGSYGADTVEGIKSLARAALAHGNGGEKPTPTPPDRAEGEGKK